MHKAAGRLESKYDLSLLAEEDMFPMNQLQDVSLVSKAASKKSFFIAYSEATVDSVASRHGPSQLHLPSKSVAREEKDDHSVLNDSSPHRKECDWIEKDISEESEESQPPWKRSRQVERTPVRISDKDVAAVEKPGTSDEPIKGSTQNEWKLALK